MTKKKLVKLLESIPDDYEVRIDTKTLRTIFADHENKQVNLSSDTALQFECLYNPLNPLVALATLVCGDKQYVMFQ